MNRPYVVGMDIGGTNTVFGIVDARGNILSVDSIKTQAYKEFGDYVAAVAEKLGMKPQEDCLMHIVWQCCSYSKTGLRLIGKDGAWVERELSRRGASLDQLWCVMADEKGHLLYLSKKEENDQT